MKQTLQLRLGQHLTMTPQLQQAIRLLQLSTLELQQEVQEALETNPMLETAEESEQGDSGSEDNAEQNTASETNRELAADSDNQELAKNEIDNIPDELPVDTKWEDIYDGMPVSQFSSSSAGENREYETAQVSGESLQEHLTWQLQMSPLSQVDKLIGETIIDSINEDGFLTTSIEDIHQSFGEDSEIDLDEIHAVLRLIQSFDPAGVAARDIRESLLLQLKQLPETPELKKSLELIENHFDLLANRDYNQLGRRLKLNEEELKTILLVIQSLNPRPGGHITNNSPEYIIPDVIVTKYKDKWVVKLNPEAAPRIRVNPTYANMIKDVHNSADNTYMKNHLQEAKWFIKSLQSRNETLLKVATSIVNHQTGFLEHGEEAMKALVLHNIAEEVDMHESTVSRVTTKKYMHTPRGIYELKYFFSSHVSTDSGGECSATAIRALLKKLILAENPNKPLSDSKLAQILSDQGINVARRTVAKYRESMAIPPSNERKRLT